MLTGPLLSSLLVSLAQTPSAEGTNPYLAQAKAHYFSLQYDRCSQRLAQASQWRSGRAELTEIELFAGLCAFYLHRESEAADHFRLALQLDPSVRLPPHTSPKIRDSFEALAASERPVPARVTPLPAPMPAPKPWLPPPPNSALRGRPLATPLTLASVGVAGLVTGVVFGVLTQGDVDRSRSAVFEQDARAAGQASHQHALVANVAFGAAVISLGAAVVVYFISTPKGARP